MLELVLSERHPDGKQEFHLQEQQVHHKYYQSIMWFDFQLELKQGVFDQDGQLLVYITLISMFSSMCNF